MRCVGRRSSGIRALFAAALIGCLGTLEPALGQIDDVRSRAVQPPAVYRNQDPYAFPMPDVTGLTVPAAEAAVLAAGREFRALSARALVVGRRPDARQAGQIIEQANAVGTPMRPYLDDVGGTFGEVLFEVVLSTGPELAPDFMGQEVKAAGVRARRLELRLSVGESRADARTRPGIIVQQDPLPGQPMTGRQVTVWPSAGFPLANYVRRPLEEAMRDAETLGFGLEQQGEDSLDFPRGIIFGQDPEPGTLLPLNGPVTVKVSRGWPVPEFVGKAESVAEDMADETRIRLAKTERDNFEVPLGIVFEQQPPARELLPPDRRVSITVSRGYPLPDLVGKHMEEARRLASELEFALEISRAPSVDRSFDEVVRQSPEPGTRLPLETAVRIRVSDGWPTPNFLALEETAAISLAAEKAVALAVVERRQDRNAQPGIVIGQDPLPATRLLPGQVVNLVVSSGYPTPRFIGLAEAEARALAAGEDVILDTTTEAHLEVDAGVVTGQFPEPDSPLPIDKMVAVTISSGWPVAPAAVGLSASAVEREFLARYPDAKVELSENVLTLEPAGTVISQYPEAGIKLGPDKQLGLVASGEMPVWVWLVAGLLALAAALAASKPWARPGPPTGADLGGIRLRVSKDYGIQTAVETAHGEADPADSEELVRIRVTADPGEQSTDPVEDKGD